MTDAKDESAPAEIWLGPCAEWGPQMWCGMDPKDPSTWTRYVRADLAAPTSRPEPEWMALARDLVDAVTQGVALAGENPARGRFKPPHHRGAP